MAPWTQRVIAGQLEKITVHNQELVARKVVAALDSQSSVQRMAILVARRACRWYIPSFHVIFDKERRSLCDNFVGSLVRAIGNRTKSIRDVPTKEGLSGIPLLKRSFLNVWQLDGTSLAPITTALYHARALTISEVKDVVPICLQDNYVQDSNRLGDALLIVEYSGREWDMYDAESLDQALHRLTTLFETHSSTVHEHKVVGKRTLPSLSDRLQVVLRRRDHGWRSSPYGVDAQSPATFSHTSEPVHATATSMPDAAQSLLSEERDSSRPYTPPSVPDDYRISSVADEQRRHDPNSTLARPHTSDGIALPIKEITRTASPWTAYFMSAIHDIPSRRNTNGDDPWLRMQSFSNDNMEPAVSASEQARQRRRPLPSPPQGESGTQSRSAKLASPDACQVAYGEALTGGLESALPAGAHRSPSMKAAPLRAVNFEEDNSIWLRLEQQTGSPVRVKIPPEFQLGEARNLARILSGALLGRDNGQNAPAAPLQFTPDGMIGQTLPCGGKSIFVEYPQDMTLAHTKRSAQRLASALEQCVPQDGSNASTAPP